MSKGYCVENEVKDREQFWRNRLELLELILPRTDLAKCVRKGINTPLHWCVFNGDVDCGMRIFRERPMMLLEKNAHGELPFDLFYNKRVRLNYYASSIKLIRKLVVDFTDLICDFYAADDDEEQRLIIGATDKRLKKFYHFLVKLKLTLQKNTQENQAMLENPKM